MMQLVEKDTMDSVTDDSSQEIDNWICEPETSGCQFSSGTVSLRLAVSEDFVECRRVDGIQSVSCGLVAGGLLRELQMETEPICIVTSERERCPEQCHGSVDVVLNKMMDDVLIEDSPIEMRFDHAHGNGEHEGGDHSDRRAIPEEQKGGLSVEEEKYPCTREVNGLGNLPLMPMINTRPNNEVEILAEGDGPEVCFKQNRRCRAKQVDALCTEDELCSEAQVSQEACPETHCEKVNSELEDIVGEQGSFVRQSGLYVAVRNEKKSIEEVCKEESGEEESEKESGELTSETETDADEPTRTEYDDKNGGDSTEDDGLDEIVTKVTEEDKPQKRGSKKSQTIWEDNYGSDEEFNMGPVRSKNELKELPPVPPVEVKLEPHHNMLPAGVISFVLGINLVVEGMEGHQALNEGSILWLTEQKLPLGIVDEVFGPVKKPFYVVRYNDTSEVPGEAKEQAPVSYVLEYANFVLNDPSLYKKRYDASGEHDEELSEDEVEFSDDEKEAEYKRQKGQLRRKNSESVFQMNEKHGNLCGDQRHRWGGRDADNRQAGVNYRNKDQNQAGGRDAGNRQAGVNYRNKDQNQCLPAQRSPCQQRYGSNMNQVQATSGVGILPPGSSSMHCLEQPTQQEHLIMPLMKQHSGQVAHVTGQVAQGCARPFANQSYQRSSHQQRHESSMNQGQATSGVGILPAGSSSVHCLDPPTPQEHLIAPLMQQHSGQLAQVRGQVAQGYARPLGNQFTQRSPHQWRYELGVNQAQATSGVGTLPTGSSSMRFLESTAQQEHLIMPLMQQHSGFVAHATEEVAQGHGHVAQGYAMPFANQFFQIRNDEVPQGFPQSCMLPAPVIGVPVRSFDLFQRDAFMQNSCSTVGQFSVLQAGTVVTSGCTVSMRPPHMWGVPMSVTQVQPSLLPGQSPVVFGQQAFQQGPVQQFDQRIQHFPQPRLS